MFSRVFLRNFRVFNEQMVSFKDKRGAVKPTIYLFGQNSSGKTSFIKGLTFVRALTDLLLFNRLLEIRGKNTKHQHRYQKTTMAQLVDHHFRKNADGPMQLVYEFYLNYEYYTYEIILNRDGRLHSEILLKRSKKKEILVLYRDKETFEIGRGMVPIKYDKVLEDLFVKYKDDYTLLSIIYYAVDQKLIEVKVTLALVLNFISTLYINHNSHNHDEQFNYKNDVLVSPIGGRISPPFTTLVLKGAELAITQLTKSLFPAVNHVKYGFEKNDDGYTDYKLRVFIKTSGKPAEIDLSTMSRSFLKVVGLSTAILDLKHFKYTVILDNMSDALHSDLLISFLSEAESYEGQLIMAFAHMDIINRVNPRFVYIVNFSVDGAEVVSVDDVHPTRHSQDIKSRYDSGVYGDSQKPEDPELGDFSDYFKR